MEALFSYEIWSLAPAVISVFLAFKYKNVYLSLFSGLYFGIFILNAQAGLGLIQSLIKSLVEIPVYMTQSMGDPWNAGIIIQVLLIGSIIYLLTYTGGLNALALTISKYAKSSKSSQLATWMMGLLIFFDDYANSLIVGPVMRTVTDKYNVSREKLAFIVDATAAPISGLVLVSTWVGYEISLIAAGVNDIGQDFSPLSIFIHSIPYRFYNIFMLIFIVLTIYMVREFGPMLKAQRRAKSGEVKKTSKIKSEKTDDIEVNEKYTAKAYEGIVPIAVLIISAITLFYYSGYSVIMAGEDTQLINMLTSNPFSMQSIATAYSSADASVVLSQAAILTILTIFLLSGLKGAFSNKEKGIDLMLSGANSLLPTIFVLLLAWSIGSIMGSDGLDTGNYIAGALGSWIPYQIVPLTIFIIAAFMAFATGTSFGTMGILMPLAIPLAWAVNPDLAFLTLSVSAVLTGTIVGDHCSPISDTTILSSVGSGVDHLDHVQTQMPYAIMVGVISGLAYLFAGIGISLVIIFITSIILLVSGLYYIGEKV